MDLIIDGRTYDFGYIYDNWKGFSFVLQKMMKNGSYNFQSEYDKNYSGARLQYKTVIKAFDKMA
jgi:hypothetical protein